MYCDSFACDMSKKACGVNKRLAVDTVEAINVYGQSIFNLEDHCVNRMLVCGDCPHSGIDREEAKTAFRSSLDALIRKIERYDEWGGGTPREEVLRTKKEYREAHAEEIKEARAEAEIKKRIKQLKEITSDTSQSNRGKGPSE